MNTPDSTRHTLVFEKEMPHPPEKIWRALTEAPLMGEWLLETDFLPVVGHRFTLRNQPMPHWNGVIDCVVLAIEPHRRLAYTWTALGLDTVVTWTLTPGGGGTRVRMEQAGFPSKDGANYKGANYGWQKFLGNLERVVAGLA